MTHPLTVQELISFNCEYGDLIRWLGGPYTDEHRDWEVTFATLETVCDCPLLPEYPIPDFERTFRACTEGVPLKATTPQTWQVASSETKPRYPQTLSKTLQMLMKHCGKKKSCLTTFFFHAFSGNFSPEFLSLYSASLIAGVIPNQDSALTLAPPSHLQTLET
jgi:hypothetical protein